MDCIGNAGEDESAAEAAGWRTTNSHPANCSSPVPAEGKVLASGIDTLVLSLTLQWRNRAFLQLLEKLKESAIAQEAEMPGVFEPPNGAEPWYFRVAPYGSQGYVWLLWNPEYYVKLTDALGHSARPNATVEIRSETLWRWGPLEAAGRIIELFEQAGAKLQPPKVSKVDPCLDLLVPEELFDAGLIEHCVSRAVYDCVHRAHRKTTGFTIGQGKLFARIYNKELEINTKSKKTWMYDIWKLPESPEGSKIIRIEFQVRREALTELGIDTIWQFFNHPVNLWSYLTYKWLKFQEDPQQDRRFQKTMLWWQTVQNGFLGVQGSCPLVRAEAVRMDKTKIAQQLMGQLTSMIAAEDDTGDITPGREVHLDEHLEKVVYSARLLKLSPKELGEKVRQKLVRYARRMDRL